MLRPQRAGWQGFSPHDRVAIFTDESNSFRISGETRVPAVSAAGRRGASSGRNPFRSEVTDGCRPAATRGLSAETREPRALRRETALKFETTVGGDVRRAPVCPIRPSNQGIASSCSMIAAVRGSLSRYIRETKNAVPGEMGGAGGREPRAMRSGISHGMPFARVDAPASGRHDATTMWGRPVRHEPVGEAAMNTISSGLIRAFLAHHRGSRIDGGSACDAVPASSVAPCRLPALRAHRVLERLSFRATTWRQRCSTSFGVSGWGALFVPDSVAPIPLQPCRAVSIAPGQCRRRLG